MDVFELSDDLWSGKHSTKEIHPLIPHNSITEIEDGLAFVSSFANVSCVDTEEGLVLIDTGSFLLAEQVHQTIRTWTDSRLSKAIYSHGHVDHVFGVPYFEAEAKEAGWEGPQVIAHEALAHRFDRYKLTRGYNEIINQRQFRAPGMVWPTNYRYPDIDYRDRYEFVVGDISFEVNHAKGETDDHSWTWIPSHRTLCCGDLFIWASPNAGNPQKVQRYPAEWAVALREMATRNAEYLLSGHGVPIKGEARVKEALTHTAELLESIVEQTISILNSGARLNDAIHQVTYPSHLMELPYLQPVYDEPEFIVRNIWRLYGGWYDGNPANLKPAKEVALANEIAALTGGAGVLATRAMELIELGDDQSLRLATHLIEFAALASDDPAIIDARRAIYTVRAETSTSTMAKGIFGWASTEFDNDSSQPADINGHLH